MIGYEVVRSIVFYAFWERIALEGVAMTAAKWFPRHMPLAVASLTLNGGMLHHAVQGGDFYLFSGQARNMRLGQAPFTSFIPIPDLGLAEQLQRPLRTLTWRRLNPPESLLFWAAPVRVPSLVLRLKLFSYRPPVKIALVRDNLTSLNLDDGSSLD